MAQRLVFEVEVVSDSVDGVSARPENSREVGVGNVAVFDRRPINKASEKRIVPAVLLPRLGDGDGLLFHNRLSDTVDQSRPTTKNTFHFGDGHFVVISSEMVIKGEDRPEPRGVVEKLARDTDAVKFDVIRLTFPFQKTRVEK